MATETEQDRREGRQPLTSSELLAALKEEAADMYHELGEPGRRDIDCALQKDFCRYMALLIKRVEERQAANSK